jgi:FtsH-binding integral membrane protein
MSAVWVPWWTALGALLLCLAFAAVFWAARRVLVAVAAADNSSAAALAFGAFAVTDVAGALVGDIAGGVVVVAVVSVVVAVGVARAAGAAQQGTVLVAPPRFSAAEVAVAAALIGVLSIAALSTYMWDERSTHLPLANAIARGVLPLEHPFFPGQALRYHAGYAVVVGVIRRATHLPVDVCADVVTIFGIVVTVLLLRRLLVELTITLFGDDAHGRGRGRARAQTTAACGVVFVLCAGGPVAAILADGWGSPIMGRGFFPSTWVNGATFPPLVVTNIFQHPQGLAMPLALVAIRLVLAPFSLPRLVVVGVVVVLLSRVQVVFSAYVGVMMAIMCAVAFVQPRIRSPGPPGVVVVVVTGVIAVAFGRVLPAAGDSALRFGGGYFAADGIAAVVHEPLVFGLALGALPIALWLRRRGNRANTATSLVVVLGVLGTVGFVVGNVAVYARSWDIVKFFGVSMFFGHIPIAVWMGTLRPRIRWVLFAVTCWSGVLWMLRHGPLQGVIAPPVPERGIPAWVSDVDDSCGHHIPPRARVWATDLDIALAGYLAPGMDWRTNRDTAALLIDRAAADEARDQRRRILSDPDGAVAVDGIGEVLVSDGDVLVLNNRTSARRTLRRWTPVCQRAGHTVYVWTTQGGGP